jgi:SAM-dependent methyltransferase
VPEVGTLASSVVAAEDPKQMVQRGYDALSLHYERAFPVETKYRSWISDLSERLSAGSRVLDIGCGSGVPVARDLSGAGHVITGIDISEEQIRRARRLVPGADLIWADITGIDFPHESVDAVVALYSLIHIPLEEQPPLLTRIAAWLRPGGWFLCTMGDDAWTGVDDNWLGSGTAMWWSHADAATNRRWITEAGLIIEHEEFVPEGSSGATLFWAYRPSSLNSQSSYYASGAGSRP